MIIMKNKFKHIICAAALVTGLSGCSDFLDILPMNEVVLENYWTEKGDVTSVVNSCYETLEHGDCLTRMGVWGELRSDNLRLGAQVSNEINEILKENLLPSNHSHSLTINYNFRAKRVISNERY